jgi:hypothetical protein
MNGSSHSVKLKGLGMNRSWPVSSYCPGIRLKGLRQLTVRPSAQRSRSPRRDSNQHPANKSHKLELILSLGAEETFSTYDDTREVCIVRIFISCRPIPNPMLLG